MVMKFTRIRDLFGIALVAALLTAIVLRLAYADLPTLPRLAGVTFGVLAVVEAILAWQLRNRITGKPGARPVQPLTAARAVALAKASSLVGAFIAGNVGRRGGHGPAGGGVPGGGCGPDDRVHRTGRFGRAGCRRFVVGALLQDPDPPQQDDNVGLR
ncbi:hypothetical protein KUTG_04821 [Kutzneria sp. 744]|nr:hypothetical protein KUTG_04821 [Kutzneria sp. 744]